MKKLFAVLFVAFSLIACELEGDQDSYVLELGPVNTVTMPAKFKTDSVSKIRVTYRQPTTCHMFNGLYYDAEANTRTVAIQFLKLVQDNCTSTVDDAPYEVYLNFKPLTPGTYLFKFWTGVDEEGTETFLEAEAIVP